MERLNEATWEADMLQAVDRNHRRAVTLANAAAQREAAGRSRMPGWAMAAVVVAFAVAYAGCIIYALCG